ncbi:sulfopyruvate decarboxylase subunit beta [Methanofollis formosanus]|uniref:sulfopyruvate decarboxylase n=1 Tax=Methanofollis formosanus TaxID=299308 RepID=A0A8G1A2M2_9EURY|nr:sulfopyruvate decarboxylase subunit beta [Methanofollis formosanus]QYZ79308.1 sulfopyruvate decarboxylase subunit beta [Methanofollis formosanus]
MHEDLVCTILEDAGVDLTLTLPCDRARDLCFLLPDRIRTVGLTREEDGVGIAAGAVLAGLRPVVVIQSSGLGNMLNAIMSLTVTFGLPLPVLASWRGVYEERIPAQIPFNSQLPGVLDALGIAYTIISEPSDLPRIGEVVEDAFARSRPHVALISPKVWEGEACPAVSRAAPARSRHSALLYDREIREPTMARYDAIRALTSHLGDAAVVSNIGVPSKELYAAMDRPLNFYMLGSYTQATPIGLGLALGTDRRVVVLDGDGSLLGSSVLPVVAAAAPENLTVIGLDNGAFGSTGNQPTYAAADLDLELIAHASGFTRTWKIEHPEAFEGVMAASVDGGPNFIHVVLRPGNAPVKNIPLTPQEIRERFVAALKGR